MDKQAEFVLRTIEERDIRFVRLWFTDVLGTLKSVAIAPAELEGAFAEGIGFDGSAIEGFTRVYESDMLAKPDPGTFSLLPWRSEGPGVARLFCDILMPRLDGYQTCTLIKKNPRFAATPVIMLSSKDGLFDRARGRLAGSDEYLTKPFTRETLLQALTDHAKSAKSTNSS